MGLRDRKATATLAALRDVDGVIGSFVVSEQGELLGQDMPRYIDREVLAELGPRAARIFDTWAVSGRGAECLLRFHGHKLYLRNSGTSLMCALLDPGVHLPSLRTAMTMVGRKLGVQDSA